MTYNAVNFLEGLFASTAGQMGPRTAQMVPQVRWSDVSVADLPADWRVWFEERAAIMEYDGGLQREWAEAEALRETVEQMRAERIRRDRM